MNSTRLLKPTRASPSIQLPEIMANPNPNPLSIIIVGAGIGGLSAAIALRQNGHTVSVSNATNSYLVTLVSITN